MIDRRRPLFAPELMVRVALAWVMICAVMLVTGYGTISAGRFTDPDDLMRLMEVRDLLAGQSWFDVHQYRVDAPSGGVAMSWSRLVDVPLAALVWLFSLFLPQATAEITAATIVPLVTFGFALLLAARIAWRLIGAEAAGMTCLVMALSVPVIVQMGPLRIDHHGWQIVLALLALNGMMARNPRRGGALTGFALALWISISVEGLPLALAICAVTALRWLGDRRTACRLTSLTGSLAISSAAIFASTRGFADLANHCDAVSPVHLAVFGWGGISVWALARCEPIPRGALVSGFALIAAGGGAIVYFAAPQCVGGGLVELDPLAAEYWSRNVREGMPVWQQSPAMALQIVVPPALGLIATLKLAGRSSAWLRQWWYDYALLLGAALLLAIFVARAGAVAGAMASIPLGWQIAVWIRGARNMRSTSRRIVTLAGTAVALMPALPLGLVTAAIPAEVRARDNGARTAVCPIAAATPVLRGLPQGEIIAPIDMGPELLNATDHSVVATGHHRSGRGMGAMIRIFTGPPDTAEAALRTRGTRYVAVCSGLMETRNYVGTMPEGFLAALLAGDEPAWLEPVAVPGDGAIRVWRITD
ncbi:hypothetical protein [Allopontixanthobacter sp.]|uniref:hypothetical protein n=1 Tax=Allopontixanthobacter sp. TaxID=2906452 RepID=UPI002ABAF9B0|nr:hypothetical protein [Allopontixanthobacter sp.]MDZ4306503.1 hypothetical protein [Allopontixanthobacter sp.]